MKEGGRTLAGRFRITGEALAEGGGGLIFPGEDTYTGREVALKVLHAHLAEDPAQLEWLRGEVALAGRLEHTRIVTVHGLWADEGRWFLVQDRAQGVPLDAIDGPLAPESVIALGLQVCEALQAAHSRGVVHGDLRPEKVIVGVDGAKVLGFRGDQGEPRVRPGETPPEVQEGAPPGRAADLYGLGLVLHRAMTGENPWSGPTPYAVLAAQQRALGPPPGPRGISALIQRLLAPAPEDRPADVDSVRTALRRLKRNPDRRVRIPERWVPPLRPRRAWMVLGVDPATGARSVFRTGLSGRAARSLAERLREEGWDVSAKQEALSGTDLLWVVVMALSIGLILPGVGIVLGGIIGYRWRREMIHPRLREVLPRVQAPLPPRDLPAGMEHAVAAGVLLLCAAALLWYYPILSLIPFLLLLGVLWSSRSRARADDGKVVRQARIAMLLAEVRAALDLRAHGLDGALGLQGELDALEQQWAEGKLPDRDVLGRVEGLRVRAEQAMLGERSAASETLDALRRG